MISSTWIAFFLRACIPRGPVQIKVCIPTQNPKQNINLTLLKERPASLFTLKFYFLIETNPGLLKIGRLLKTIFLAHPQMIIFWDDKRINYRTRASPIIKTAGKHKVRFLRESSTSFPPLKTRCRAIRSTRTYPTPHRKVGIQDSCSALLPTPRRLSLSQTTKSILYWLSVSLPWK